MEFSLAKGIIFINIGLANGTILNLWAAHPSLKFSLEPPLFATAAYNGRKLVFDNVDLRTEVHSMTEAHQNEDEHWVSVMVTENGISHNHRSNIQPLPVAILSLQNSCCIPNEKEHKLQIDNYAAFVGRMIKSTSLAFSFCKMYL